MAGATKAHVSSWRHLPTKEKRLDVLEKHHTSTVKGVKDIGKKHRSTKPGRPGRLDTEDASYLEGVHASAKDKLKDIEGKRAVDAGDWNPDPEKVKKKKAKMAGSAWARRGKAALGVVGGAAAGGAGAYGVDRYMQGRKKAETPATKEMPTKKYGGKK